MPSTFLSLLLPAVVSILTTIIVNYVGDRLYPWLHKGESREDVIRNGPKVSVLQTSVQEIDFSKGDVFFCTFVALNEVQKHNHTECRRIKSAAEFPPDQAQFRVCRIVNNTSKGCSIAELKSTGQKESGPDIFIRSGQVDAGETITICMEVSSPFTAITLLYSGFLLSFDVKYEERPRNDDPFRVKSIKK